MAAAPTYENHLKTAYSVKLGEKILAITDSSCYLLAEETAWLTVNLPEAAIEDVYLRSLSELGLAEPRKIFNKLVSIGALREKTRRTWKNFLGTLLTPQIRLLPAQLQERIIGSFISGPESAHKIVRILAAVSPVGLSWGAWMLFAGGKAPLADKPEGLLVIALVALGSLLHELGHSFVAMAAGIGLRPIGFSVYLIYPVFYTNVSGIEKVSLTGKVLIDCGGFIFQGVFLLLLLACSFLGNPSFAEAARWITAIILFNLNPFFRTDGYWLYKDIYSEFSSRRAARLFHYFYLSASFVFTAWFLCLVMGRAGVIWHSLNSIMRAPMYFFSGGYRALIGIYFVFLGLDSGLRRFKEGRQEWRELRKIQL